MHQSVYSFFALCVRKALTTDNQRPVPYIEPGGLTRRFIPQVSPDGSRILYTSVNDFEGTIELFTYKTALLTFDITTDVPAGTSVRIEDQLTGNSALDIAMAWSPSGEQILFLSDRAGSFDLYIMDADGSNVRQLTRNETVGDRAAWSPDGSQIAYQVRSGEDIAEVHIINADGTGTRQITETNAFNNPTSWMPDGKSLLICSSRAGNFDIFEIGLDGTVIRQITNTIYNECFPKVSPDGSKIVFIQEPGNGARIVVMDIDGTHWDILTDGQSVDLFPDWLPVRVEVDTCTMIANGNANLRSGPGTNFDFDGTTSTGAELTAIGQNVPNDKFTWWRLDSGAWVREDLVTAAAECTRLPFSGVDN